MKKKIKIFLKIKMLFQMTRLFSVLACVGNAKKKKEMSALWT